MNPDMVGRKNVFAILLLSLFTLETGLQSCKPKSYNKRMDKRKRKLKRKYKRSGINDCPVFDCRLNPKDELGVG